MHHLLYDGECSFCAGFARWLRGRCGAELETVPFSDRERTRELAPELDDRRLHASFHLVSPSGLISSGPDAVPMLIRLALPAGGFLAWLLVRAPGSKRLLQLSYDWISEHRW